MPRHKNRTDVLFKWQSRHFINHLYGFPHHGLKKRGGGEVGIWVPLFSCLQPQISTVFYYLNADVYGSSPSLTTAWLTTHLPTFRIKVTLVMRLKWHDKTSAIKSDVNNYLRSVAVVGDFSISAFFSVTVCKQWMNLWDMGCYLKCHKQTCVVTRAHCESCEWNDEITPLMIVIFFRLSNTDPNLLQKSNHRVTVRPELKGSSSRNTEICPLKHFSCLKLHSSCKVLFM